MFALERQKRILELLEENGSVWVSRLSVELGVTEETVRRDLEKLEAQEALMRTHGGAVPVSQTSYELSYEKRKRTNVDVKQKLAKAASAHVMAGDTVFLDASTTTFYMARELKGLRNLTVITNSVRIVSELAGCDGIKLIAVGGVVSDNQSYVGDIAVQTIEREYFAGKMFFSSKGVTAAAGILDSNEFECATKAAMLKNCEEAYYLCDSSKIGKVGFLKLAGFEQIQHVITDAALEEDFANALESWHILVEIIE